jgi:hypothetical protein
VIKYNFYAKNLILFLAFSMVAGISFTAKAAYQTIHNDFFWYDQDGVVIKTRSGCLRKFNNIYYWYGSPVSSRSMDQMCYSSTDMIHWTNKGVVLRLTVETNRMDVLYNDSTKKYVMFLKYNSNAAFLGIATATAPDGQFTFLSQTLVGGAKIGDMSMYKDDDGKAYLAYVWDSTGSNRQHGIYLMSSDYLTLDKRIYLWDIHSREAPHIFKRSGTYYYGVSETNGIQPSPTRYYTATDLSGPWTAPVMLVTPGSSTTYETQCDFVLPFTGTKGTFYMMGADRWIPTGPKQGDYVWMPMEFNAAGNPTMDYYQDWDFDLNAGTWRPFDYSSNLALHKTATASSVNGANAANNVTDSTTYLTYVNYRWESAASDPQWIMVDLGAAKDINRVILKWHTNFAKAFQIQTSTNSTTWTDVYSTTKGSSYSVTDVTFSKTSARYVRMYGTQRGTTNGYSLFNFMVLNDSSATPTTFKPEISPIPNKTFLKCQNNTIRYSIPLGNSVRLEAFDAQGKLTALVDGFQTSGSHEVDLSGKIGRGLYIFMLTTGGRKITTMQIRL